MYDAVVLFRRIVWWWPVGAVGRVHQRRLRSVSAARVVGCQVRLASSATSGTRTRGTARRRPGATRPVSATRIGAERELVRAVAVAAAIGVQLVSDGTTDSTWTARGTLDGLDDGSTVTDVDVDALGRLVTWGANSYSYDGLDRLIDRCDGSVSLGL